MFNIETLQPILKKLNASNHLLVALSGGLDSQALLHALVMLKANVPQLNITAVHIDHSLSPNAALWTKHCQETCAELKVKLIVKKIKAKIAPKSGLSQEAYARDLRYQVLAKLLKKNDCLLTAHHADDQAETLLLQLLRGAGPKGLAAMPSDMPLGKGRLLRPLLSFSRQDLLEFAKKNKLTWIDDESNANLKIDRNYIRHAIMPKIKKRWFGALTTLARVAKHAAEADELLTELAKLDYQKTQGTKEATLSVTKLRNLSEARQRNVLRYWLHLLNLPTPSSIKLEQIQKDILLSRYDAVPLVTWKGAEVRRYGDDIYAMPPLPKSKTNLVLIWNDLTEPLQLPYKLGALTCHYQRKLTAKTIKQLKNKISVRFRVGGEVCRLPKRQGTHTLKKLLQEWQAPPWQRTFIPLIYYKEELIAIVGFANCVGLEEKFKTQINFVIKNSVHF